MAKGKMLLKVSGILFFISGVISFLIGVGADAVLLESAGKASVKAELVGTLTVMFVICGLFEVVAGFFAVKFANVPEKASLLMILGGITLIIAIVTAIMNGLGSGASLVHMMITAVSAVILSVIYILGAFMNRAK